MRDQNLKVATFARSKPVFHRASMGLKMNLAERLKKVRENLGFTQKEMAKALGTNPQTWQVYESGKSVPGGNVFEALARLGFNVNWILTGLGSKHTVHAGDVWSEKMKEIRGDLNIPQFVKMAGFNEPDNAIETIQAIENGKLDPDLGLLIVLSNELDMSLDWFLGWHDSQMKRTDNISELDTKLITLIYEVIEEIDDGQILSPEQKSELFSFVYQMNRGSKYTKERLKRFIEAVCIFIEQGIDFNKLSDRKLSNIIIEIAHHVVKGGAEVDNGVL